MTKDEQPPIILDDETLMEEHIKICRSLVGRVNANGVIGVKVLRQTMGSIWKISKVANFKAVGNNMFMITFSIEADKERVMARRPWLFDQLFLASSGVYPTKLNPVLIESFLATFL